MIANGQATGRFLKGTWAGTGHGWCQSCGWTIQPGHPVVQNTNTGTLYCGLCGNSKIAASRLQGARL